MTATLTLTLIMAHQFYFTHICLYRKIPVAFGLRLTSVAIEASNPAEGMDVYLLCL